MLGAYVLCDRLLECWYGRALSQVRTPQHICHSGNVGIRDGLATIWQKSSWYLIHTGSKYGSTCLQIRARSCSTERNSGLEPEL